MLIYKHAILNKIESIIKKTIIKFKCKQKIAYWIIKKNQVKKCSKNVYNFALFNIHFTNYKKTVSLKNKYFAINTNVKMVRKTCFLW